MKKTKNQIQHNFTGASMSIQESRWERAGGKMKKRRGRKREREEKEREGGERKRRGEEKGKEITQEQDKSTPPPPLWGGVEVNCQFFKSRQVETPHN